MAAAESRRRARVQWSELCNDSDYHGMWVALDAVVYDSGTPVEGIVVDSDDDLASLCARVQTADHVACAILFCDDSGSGIRRASG